MKTRIYPILIIFITILVSSCSKDWLDINTDPNNPEKASAANVFPAGVMSVGAQFNSFYNISGSMWAQIWTQNNSSNQYKDFDSYNITPNTLDNQFDELYEGGLNDLEYVKKKSLEEKDWRFYLMATVVQSYTFQYLVDLYDQIPFSEAFKGPEGIIAPHYESGQAVYDSLITRINFALNQDFDKVEFQSELNSDFLFHGDVEKWIQFANTLKLKIYLRQVYARPDVAQAGITAMVSDPDFAGFLEEDAALTQFVDEDSKSNPLYELDQRKLNTQNNIKASYTFMSWLSANKDPRIPFLFMKNSTGSFAGMYQGNFEASTTEIDPATISRALIKATDPVIFLSAAESFYLQAEAALRFNVGSYTDEEAYYAGLEMAFDRFGIAAGSIPAAYDYPAGGTFDQKLEAIIVQKWASLAGSNGIEAFIEHNRTGYPKKSSVPASDPSYVPGTLVHPLFAVLAEGLYPKRLMFPDNERSRNKNVPENVSATTPVWWNK